MYIISNIKIFEDNFTHDLALYLNYTIFVSDVVLYVVFLYIFNVLMYIISKIKILEDIELSYISA